MPSAPPSPAQAAPPQAPSLPPNGDAPRKTWRQKLAGLSRRTKLAIFIFFTINLFIALAFIILGKSRINRFFNDMGTRLRDMGYVGVLIPGSVVVLCSHPPLIGFSATMTLIGYAWGLHPGLLFGALFSQLGGVVAWFSVRTFFLGWMRAEGARKNRHWEAFGHVVKERGLLLVIMIRWCPIPFAFGNGLLAAIEHVQFWQYALANLSFLPRLAIPVFIGSRLRSLGNDSPDPARWWVNLVSIVIALACGLTTGVLVYRRTLVQLHALDDDPEHAGHHDGDIAADALASGRVLSYGAMDDAEREAE